MRENIFIFSIILIIHPIFSYICHLEGDGWCNKACNDNTYKGRCPDLKKVCDDREKNKYCYIDGIKDLKSFIYNALIKCNLLDEFDNKKCNPGFYPKRICHEITRQLYPTKEIRRSCYPIHQECKKKQKMMKNLKYVW